MDMSLDTARDDRGRDDEAIDADGSRWPERLAEASDDYETITPELLASLGCDGC